MYLRLLNFIIHGIRYGMSVFGSHQVLNLGPCFSPFICALQLFASSFFPSALVFQCFCFFSTVYKRNICWQLKFQNWQNGVGRKRETGLGKAAATGLRSARSGRSFTLLRSSTPTPRRSFTIFCWRSRHRSGLILRSNDIRCRPSGAPCRKTKEEERKTIFANGVPTAQAQARNAINLILCFAFEAGAEHSNIQTFEQKASQ